jgi:peroxiredoxin
MDQRKMELRFNLQVHKASTDTSVVALVRPFASTRMHKAANLRNITALSSFILLKL